MFSCCDIRALFGRLPPTRIKLVCGPKGSPGMEDSLARSSQCADVVSLALDARKPIATFAKLIAKRHDDVDASAARRMRKRANEELYTIPNTVTPYGGIVEETTMGTFVWMHINIFAWFWFLAAESKLFFDLMKSVVDRAQGGCIRLSLYTDEVVPRNKLRPDKGGSYQAVYFQVLDFPEWIRHRLPLKWFTFGYASVSGMIDAGVGVGQLMRIVLRSWFARAPWNLQRTGVRLKHGNDVVHWFARYACSPQDERAQKYGFDLKGSSGRNPCATCNNCMGRVPFFEDDSGFVHVWSPCFEKCVPRTPAMAIELLDQVEHAAKHGSKKELADLELISRYCYDKNGLLFDKELRQYIDFPYVVDWDWMHNWCSSGGIGQFHFNGFVQVIAATLNMQLKDFDSFAAKVSLPKSSPRLPKHWFTDRVVVGDGHHVRAFATEVLIATQVLAMFVQLVLKPCGVLTMHIECFEKMQELFAIFKRSRNQDIGRARELTTRHHLLYLELYSHAKPKLHYCMHVIDCWERHDLLLSCFGAESNHRFSSDIFNFAYNKATTTALAFDLRRLTQAVLDAKTFAPTYLAGTVASWAEALSDTATLTGSSMELVGPSGKYFKKDLVEWVAGGVQKLGVIKCAMQLTVGCQVKFAVLVEELQHVGAGVWSRHCMSIVNSDLLQSTLPFVEEDGMYRPVYVGI